DGVVPGVVVGHGTGGVAEPRPVGRGGGLRGVAGEGVAVGGGAGEGGRSVRGAAGGGGGASGAELLAVGRPGNWSGGTSAGEGMDGRAGAVRAVAAALRGVGTGSGREEEPMQGAHWWLVCYDVRDPDRLRKTAKHLEGYGERVQYSVFRCWLTRLEM